MREFRKHILVTIALCLAVGSVVVFRGSVPTGEFYTTFSVARPQLGTNLGDADSNNDSFNGVLKLCTPQDTGCANPFYELNLNLPNLRGGTVQLSLIHI
mgnify:CR=1 FL=1